MKNRTVKISPDLRDRYEKRRLELEKAGKQDPDSALLPIEKWKNGEIGKFYRPLKTPISIRIDNDVLAWLKSKGEGHISRVNDILLNAMLSDLKR